MSQSRESVFAGELSRSGQLTDLQLPRSPKPADEAAHLVERQIDQLIDLLAAERPVTDSEGRLVSNVPTFTGPEDESIGVELADDTALSLELSIVMPCLNEADTVGNCVLKALYAIEKMGVTGEVIVADNGSSDDSVAIASELGAKIVRVEKRGYGAALMGGIEAARGRFVLMGDADDSYDFSQAHRFYKQLKEGAELVQGCRLSSGGGRVMPGAMPWLHQLGNPALTWCVRTMFRAPIHDVYCGMRGFTKELYQRIDQRCTGMEFATEMIIKSSVFGAKIEEIPIILHPDGRKKSRPHLRTFRDGWRTLRCFMMFSPRWSFLAPGALLGVTGAIGCSLAAFETNVAGVTLGLHTLLVSMVAMLMGVQLGWFALMAKTFAASAGILPRDERTEAFSRCFTLERTLLLSCALIAAGGSAIVWKATHSTDLASGAASIAHLLPAVGAIALGVQFAFSSVLLNFLRFARR